MKSIIRWAGSKRSLLPALRPVLPKKFGRYIEAFAGSACLFFDLRPDRATISDLNQELITTFRAVRRDASLVVAAFRRLRRGKTAYYRIRAVNPATLSPVEVAARFLYLNRYCFNGLYRTNMAGRFNVPYGPPQKPLVKFEDDVVQAGLMLRSANLACCDFEITLKSAEKGDFVYLDPPFVLDERRVFTEYLPGSFGPGDLGRLSDSLADLDRRGVIFLLSYADSERARRLARPWHSCRVWTQRNIAGFTGARRGDYEILASNKAL
jgi:DNA adenine methylase